MSRQILFKGQAVKAEMVVLILEKWELHPILEEIGTASQSDDLERETRVTIPDDELEQAKNILWGESEFDRAGF